MTSWKRPARVLALIASSGLVAAAFAAGGSASATTATAKYDINTLSGKVASLNGTAGLQIRFSALVQEEARESSASQPTATPITPVYVQSSSLDGTTVAAPDVTVNQDTAAAPQNETTIAVDPNNPRRLVAGANDYVTRTWSCTVGGTPCSALGDGYSGTYYSNDGGATWAGLATDPSNLGTLIPGVEHLTGGPYDAGGDPSVAFDSQGTAYYAGIGFNRTSAPNTVTVSRGTFDGNGKLTWGAPTFVDQTSSPSVFNDKEWIAADSHASSPYRDRVYVTFTRFVFNPSTGAYVQSPIFFAYSTDGGATFSKPEGISGNVLYDQGSRPMVGPDGTLYVIYEGATRLSTLDSTYIVKSTDGGATFSKPVKIAELQDIIPPADTVFRVNSFPAGAVAPNGDLYVAWSTQEKDGNHGICPTATNKNCYAEAVYSESVNGGATWTKPAPVVPGMVGVNRTAVGDFAAAGITPDVRPVDTFWPAVAVSPSGDVYMSAYAADVVSPWQTCAAAPAPPEGRVNCTKLGDYVDNARLDYLVQKLNGAEAKVTTQPINSRYGFGGLFIGDYTDLAVGSDNRYHAFWTDTNNVQDVTWFYGLQFTPTQIHQQDVVTASGSF